MDSLENGSTPTESLTQAQPSTTPDGNNVTAQSQTPSQNTKEARLEKLRETMEALRNGAQDGQESSPPPDDETPAEQPGETPAPRQGELSTAELAEKLGVSETDLYKMKLNTGDGEAVTFEKLKADYVDRAKLRRDAADKALDLERRESQHISDTVAMGILDAMQAVPTEVSKKANQHMIQRYQRDYQNYLTLAPDLQDDNTRIAFEKKQGEHLREHRIAHLLDPVSVLDGSGAFRLYVKKAMRNAELLEQYRKAEKPEPPKPVGKSKGTQAAASITPSAKRGRASAQTRAKAQKVAEALRTIKNG